MELAGRDIGRDHSAQCRALDVAAARHIDGDRSVTAVEVHDDRVLPPGRMVHQEVGYWGMVLFVFTEAALFAYLLSSYFYLGVTNASWPPAGVERPKLGKPLVMTALLLTSSIVLYVAEKAREDGKKVFYRVGTLVTILLGFGFLGLQVAEYRDKLKNMPPQAHAYASIFYTITGFHGSHVAFGLLLLMWTLLADVRGRLRPLAPIAVKNSSLYWHFVDAVWIAILTCLYLSPRWY
jgi:heme/copper-type cytochrome/quinol oxidase subunit 3